MKAPLIIGIGGGHSGSGKTTLASALLTYFKGKGERWAAVKYTRTAIYSSVIDDREILSQEGKDTGKFLRAGAEQVLWAQAPQEEICDVLPMAIDRLTGFDGIIIEGNSAIEFLKPNVVVFLHGDSQGRLKASGERLLSSADIIISGSPPVRNDGPSVKDTIIILPESPDIETLVKSITKVAEKKEIEGMLMEKAVDGKIACNIARGIAETLGVSKREVGAAADRLSIKIKECELGCF
ncbi:MAG: molybdopterin-guanine dinucleotide biosynthesis protein B [Nitrospirales bacterium]|nr:molybdopterin-guanine dinucleotide biosynthesis protein B [Nitrospirales bacterium]